MSSYNITLVPQTGPTRLITITQPSLSVSIIDPSDRPTFIQGEPGPVGAKGDAGPMGPPGPSVSIKRDVFNLNTAHISTKTVTLSASPSSDWVLFMPDRGIPQRSGIDFLLQRDDNTIRWTNMGLDGVLRVNDRIEVHYLIKD